MEAKRKREGHGPATLTPALSQPQRSALPSAQPSGAHSFWSQHPGRKGEVWWRVGGWRGRGVRSRRSPRGRCWGGGGRGGRRGSLTDKPGPGGAASPPPRLCPGGGEGGAHVQQEEPGPARHTGCQASHPHSPTMGGPHTCFTLLCHSPSALGGVWRRMRSPGDTGGWGGKSWGGGWGITEHGELGPSRAQGGLRGLALVGGVVRQLGVRDLQVVLPGVRRAHDPVPRPGCRDMCTGRPG